MDFNILDCFRLFDRKENGALSSSELEDTLIEIGLDVENTNNLLLLFVRYDSDGDGKLRYTDFINIFTPRLKEFSELLLSREGTDYKTSKVKKVYPKK
jgi:Ca2+-binding EF-hand superfamily protein